MPNSPQPHKPGRSQAAGAAGGASGGSRPGEQSRTRKQERPAPARADERRSRVVVLGIGQMGLVCAAILSTPPAGAGAGVGRAGKRGAPEPGANGATDWTAAPREVVLWGHSVEEAGSLTQTRRSPRLPGFTLPDSVSVTAREAEAVRGALVIISAIPVQYTRAVWERIRKAGLPPTTRVISVAKGIENKTLLRPTQAIAEALADDPDARPRPLGTLSGPTIAAELARCLPATMIAASDTPLLAQEAQRLFSTSWLRVYTSDDLLGVELAGATKNVIAIAAGVLDGLQAGYNAKSALLARGLAEITRLGSAMGAGSETFFGLSGVGDLATTCFSPEGRNRSLGEALGRGEKLDDYLKRSTSVVEGVATTRSVMDLARKYRVDMPITEAVHAVLFEGMDPIEAIGKLMSRELKRERVG